MAKTLNALMRHLRDSGISIYGSNQKRRLKNIGYYHGYKGYRFAGEASNRLPVTDFSEIATLYEFDMQLKTLFYSRVMAVETALKNYTLEAVLEDAGSETMDVIFRKTLTGYKDLTGKAYRKAWANRQRLRGEIDSLVYHNHNSRDVIGHFRDSDKDIPVWAILEVMTLGNFGAFYDCLAKRVKSSIVRDIGMPSNLDSELRLKDMIYTLKDFRNAIAHNGVVVDTRFRSGSVNTGVTQLIKQETGIAKVTFTDITDYVVLLVYLMRSMRFTRTECRKLLSGYQLILEHYRAVLPYDIYGQLISTDARRKINLAKEFVSKGH